MPAKYTTPEFKESDSTLKEIVAQRRNEVVALQTRQAEQLKDLEARGQSQIQVVRQSMSKDQAELLEKLDTHNAAEAKRVAAYIQTVKAKHVATALAIEELTITPRSLLQAIPSWLTPYYATLHGSDGSVYWQGYNPGNFDLWDSASGAGTGWFGTGAASFTVYLDWWFDFNTAASRFYNFTIYVPYHGFYIVYADDGFFTSKEARVSIDLSAQGYQYNWKPQSSTNVLSIDSQNIDVNDRFDGWRTMYYGDLLGGGDTAYLRVSSSFYVYARGGGSFAELNFSDGAANYIGVPFVYVT